MQRFSTFCGVLVGGYTLLQLPLRLLYCYLCLACTKDRLTRRKLADLRLPASRFLAGLLSAWFSIQIIYPTKVPKSEGTAPGTSSRSNTSNLSSKPRPLPVQKSGKTIDLTVLAVARAIDTLTVNLWRRSGPTSRVSTTISRYTDTLIFALSSGTIMWTWFYHPSRLPPAYNKWIGSAAQVDSRLIEVLREARAGRFVYGKDTSQAPVLQGMCRAYKWPLEWGDPAKTVPIPCELVHMGTGPNCHWHALVRFGWAFRFAMATNLPLQLLFKARSPSLKAFKKAVEEAARSSTFLGAFVALFYYGVCLSRTQLGPKLFSGETISPMMWDSGLCVGAGCILCGWSILIEVEKRRQELALFVAPRALATCLPREYDAKVGFLMMKISSF